MPAPPSSNTITSSMILVPSGGEANGVAAPAFVLLFVYGKVEGDKLPGFEAELFQLGHLYPESACVMGFLYDTGHLVPYAIGPPFVVEFVYTKYNQFSPVSDCP